MCTTGPSLQTRCSITTDYSAFSAPACIFRNTFPTITSLAAEHAPPVLLWGHQGTLKGFSQRWNQTGHRLSESGWSAPCRDKIECFDRIVPSITAALMLALGLPKGIVNMFTMMYRGLKKHLSYRNWIAKSPVTNANGVAQGCSLSLIAINGDMHVWACFIDRSPSIICRVFTDDAYMWVAIHNVHLLQQAFQATELWGQLVGQRLNKRVCCGPPLQRRVLPQNPPSLNFLCPLNLVCWGPRFTLLSVMLTFLTLPNAVRF